MGIFALFVLALGLSMDAFAVSISNSMCYAGISRRQQAVASLTFGVFQGIMPILGFWAGNLFARQIMAVDHWVALILLGFIGIKMIVEGAKNLKNPEACEVGLVYNTRTLLVQAVATSIDALAVGVSLALLEVNIFTSALLIAAVTCLCCLLGSALGRRFGNILGDWAQVVGGLILTGIGVKIFVEHMFFGG